MNYLPRMTPFLLAVFGVWILGCAPALTPEQKVELGRMKEDLSRIQKEVQDATLDDDKYSGGLIKSMIAIRLQVLKTNEALIEQRIHALESGAKITVVVDATKPDTVRAAELAKEIENQRAKIEEARVEAAQYSGGLLQAISETNVATNRNTLAILEQQYFVVKYGLSIPSAAIAQAPPTETSSATSSISKTAKPAVSNRNVPTAGDCLKIEVFDSSVLSTNDVFTELAWKVDVSNTCSEGFSVRVNFTLYDADEFTLDSDYENVYVPAGGTGKARGKMLVSPPSKARRMARQGASLSFR